VAVIGDNNLDERSMEPSLVAGDETNKQQVAKEVGAATCRCSNSDHYRFYRVFTCLASLDLQV